MAMHAPPTIVRRSRPALSLVIALAAPSASGQTASLDIVDERIEDVSPLAVSLRESRPSLRQPADFGRVYRFQDGTNRLTRAQGALYAVFPRSVYASDKDGNVFPVVPPGTVFYIGPPAGFTAATAHRDATGRDGAGSGRIDGRLDARVAPRLMTAPVPRHRQQDPLRGRRATGIVGDPEYRARRLRSLMQDAANARRSLTPREDGRHRRRSIPGTPANGPATPSGG